MATEQRLILLSAGTRQRREETQREMAELAARADWQLLTKLLANARLLPTLGPRLLAIGGDRADEAMGALLVDVLDSGRRKDALLHLVGERTTAALAAAGIRSATLKGPPMAGRLYGEPARRLSGDIDILVAPDQLLQAADVVRGLGYRPPQDEVDADGFPLLHFSLVHSRGQLPPVELHWRVHWYERSFSADRLLPPTAEGKWQPEPEDELASLLLFYARDGFTGLRQASDLAAWWDRFGGDLPAGGLESVAEAYPALQPALSVGLVVANRTVGLPSYLLDQPLESLGRRGRIAVCLADHRPYASREQLFAEVGLVDGLLAPREEIPAFFRRQVAPPRRVIREHAEKAGVGGPVSSLGYGIRMLTRYLLALGRLVHIPGTNRLRFGREAARAREVSLLLDVD